MGIKTAVLCSLLLLPALIDLTSGEPITYRTYRILNDGSPYYNNYYSTVQQPYRCIGTKP